jgi:spore coat protein A, manganese oxidase
MLTRRTFLNSSSSLLALCAIGNWSIGRADAAVLRHRPRGNRPSQPFDAAATRKFVTPLINPLDPAFPGVRRPAANEVATLTIKELTTSLGLNRPNGVPLATRIWGYGWGQTGGGTIPGPTFEVTQGRPLTVTYVNGLDGVPNRMPVDTTLEWANPGALGGLAPVPLVTHLHGARSESRSDGLPEAWSTPNDEFTGRLFAKPYHYQNEQEAAHLWYHDHVLGITRLNVYMGLAGFYFIRDANEDRLRASNVLPSFPYEIPLMLQDRTFDQNGQLFYPSEDPETPGLPSPTHLPEFFGDVILVNGQAWPVQAVAQRKYRFRILNASDSRFYAIKVQRQTNPASGPSSPTGPALPILVIGTELGLLNRPAAARWQSPPLPDGSSGGISEPDTLLVGPGERYDVIVDFSNVPAGTRLLLWNGAATPYTGQPPDGVDYVAPTPGLTDRLMAFDVVPRNPYVPDATVALGTLLRTSETTPLPSPSTAGVPRRQILMYEGTDSFGRLQTMLGTLVQGTLVYSDPITEQPRAGKSEVWEFFNTTADAHPIHMHLVDFRIVNRQDFAIATVDKTNSDGSTGASVVSAPQFLGSPVAAPPHEVGKKDTVVAYPGQVTRLLVNFSRAGEYVYHCHILSHEDHEMMRRYEVVPSTT